MKAREMNTIHLRRRWLLLRPWLSDIATGVLMVAFVVSAVLLAVELSK